MMSIYPIVLIQLSFVQFSLLCYEFCILSKKQCTSIYYHFRRDHESSSFWKLARNKWIHQFPLLAINSSIIFVDFIQELARLREKEIRDRESIQKEIDKALGTNLTQHKRSKKKSNPKDVRKARYARLTKIETGNTNQKRLEKKIFNKRALEKAYEVSETVTKKKHAEKFGSNFNYNIWYNPGENAQKKVKPKVNHKGIRMTSLTSFWYLYYWT